ncbi:MAG: hypothetical protein R3F21_22625 [Myxococcota bacterium]
MSKRNRAIAGAWKAISIGLIVGVLSPSLAWSQATANAEGAGSNVSAGSTENWWDRLIPPTSMANDAARVDLHGYGSWAWADTDGNPYLGGTADSAFDVITGGLLVSAKAFDRLAINAQLSADTREGDSDISLERAFAEWTFADWLKLRGGRLPHPIGIYSEVLNVGTTRPFFDLPQGVYGPTGTTTLSYDGAGLTGSIIFHDWELIYDAYAGKAIDKFAAPYVVDITGNIPGPGSVVVTDAHDTFGGRLQILPPIEGLTVGVSAYRAEIDSSPGLRVERIVYGAQFEFARENYSLRAEYYKQEADEYKTNADNAYVMGTIRPLALLPLGESATFFDRIELSALWTLYKIRRVDPVPPGFPLPVRTPKQLKNHREWAVGLNYWFTPTFVARAEYHRIYDNVFAHEGSTLLAKLGPPRDLDNQTQLVKVGLDFSF